MAHKVRLLIDITVYLGLDAVRTDSRSNRNEAATAISLERASCRCCFFLPTHFLGDAVSASIVSNVGETQCGRGVETQSVALPSISANPSHVDRPGAPLACAEKILKAASREGTKVLENGKDMARDYMA